MNYQELRNKYIQKVKEYTSHKLGIQASEHLTHVLVNVLMNRDGVINHGGHFVDAVLKNDLRGAIERADHEIGQNIRVIVMAITNLPTPVLEELLEFEEN